MGHVLDLVWVGSNITKSKTTEVDGFLWWMLLGGRVIKVARSLMGRADCRKIGSEVGEGVFVVIIIPKGKTIILYPFDLV